MAVSKELKARQLRRALQLFIQDGIQDESVMMEVADVYPAWKTETAYAADTILKYGENTDGETQLWRVLQPHTSQQGWEPDKASSLFKKVGFTESGTSIWTQPLGAADAYAKDDIVEHNGKTWISTADSNVWEPGVYGWEEQPA